MKSEPFFILFFQLKQLWSERVTGRVFRLRPRLMKNALNEDNNRPHPIARKPVKTNKHVRILVYFPSINMLIANPN